MSYLDSLFPTEFPTTSSKRAQRRHDRAWWLGVAHDLELVRGASVNVMMVGPERVVDELLRRLTMEMATPVAVQCCDAQLRLPSPASCRGAVLLKDIDALTMSEQHRLMTWLDEADARGPVISTASSPLLPLVKAGLFSEALLYRLNTTYIDLLDGDPGLYWM